MDVRFAVGFVTHFAKEHFYSITNDNISRFLSCTFQEIRNTVLAVNTIFTCRKSGEKENSLTG